MKWASNPDTRTHSEEFIVGEGSETGKGDLTAARRGLFQIAYAFLIHHFQAIRQLQCINTFVMLLQAESATECDGGKQESQSETGD